MAGLQKGDRIALILPDTCEFVTSFLGAVLAGIIPVPMYPPAGTIQIERYVTTAAAIVARSRPRVVLAPTALHGALCSLAARGVAAPRLLSPEQLDLAATFHPECIRSEDIAFLQFTSGSTSHPKGVSITHANVAANSDAIDAAFALDTEDVPISWLPLFHDMGLIGFLVTALYGTVATRFMSTQMFLRRPMSWLRAISDHRGTISVAPNFAFTLLNRRLKNAEIETLDLSSWRIAGCGAEPICASTLRSFAERLACAGFRSEAFMPMYGLAEATLAVTIPRLSSGLRTHGVDAARLRTEGVALTRDDAGASHIVSCGSPLPVNDVEIFDPNDDASVRPLAEGEVGEIRVRGPNVLEAYWDDPEATAAAFAGKYLRSGDLGYMREGELYVCGRLKELIIVNGRNYAPQDIERAALSVPGVRAAIAFQTRMGACATEAKLVVAAEAAMPDRVEPTLLQRAISGAVGLVAADIVLLLPGQLPKTSSGKPRRIEAWQMYETGLLRAQPRKRRQPVHESTPALGWEKNA
jgi:acyl-CoA synthetase (AMP-forming)/AMP-acid ligase II